MPNESLTVLVLISSLWACSSEPKGEASSPAPRMPANTTSADAPAPAPATDTPAPVRTAGSAPESLETWVFAGAPGPALAGLSFGMDPKAAWDAAPALHEAMQITLEASEYDELAALIPELGEGRKGGNRWFSGKSRRGQWPTIDGVAWELRFEPDRGLAMITARFPSEPAMRAAIADWGPPTVDARWEFWIDEASRTRAAYTQCYGEGEGRVCPLEFMPYRPLEQTLAQLFPDGKTLIGTEFAELEFGRGLFEGDFYRYQITPLPTSLWIPIHVQLEAGESGRVSAYRTALSHTYDANASSVYAQALSELIGETSSEAGCEIGTLDAQPVRVCNANMQHALTVGTWK